MSVSSASLHRLLHPEAALLEELLLLIYEAYAATDHTKALNISDSNPPISEHSYRKP